MESLLDKGSSSTIFKSVQCDEDGSSTSSGCCHYSKLDEASVLMHELIGEDDCCRVQIELKL